LRLPAQAIDLGGVLVERGEAFASAHPDREDAIKRILTLKLATVREDGEPARRRASRSEFSDDEWRLVGELADHPNRLVVTAVRYGGEAYAEIAHETVFRRWDGLREWIAEAREFLIWKSSLEADRRTWSAAPARADPARCWRALKLAQAQAWLRSRAADVEQPERDFIAASRQAARWRLTRLWGMVAAAPVAVGLLAIGVEIGEYHGVGRYPGACSSACRPMPPFPSIALKRTTCSEHALRESPSGSCGGVSWPRTGTSRSLAAICVRALPWSSGALGCGSRSGQDVRCSVRREYRRRGRVVRG
jgi:hypothetical protein